VSKSPSELAPVRPVLEFSMVDPRFVAESDALSELDQRPGPGALAARPAQGVIVVGRAGFMVLQAPQRLCR